jgi:hypothetical protein
MLTTMLEESMALIGAFLSAKIGKVEAVKLAVRSLVEAAKKDPEYIKKALLDAEGDLRLDGTFDRIKLITLSNNVAFDEAKRAQKLCQLLKLIFEQRLAAIEQASGQEIKDKIMSDYLANARKITGNKKYTARIGELFLSYVVPGAPMPGK